MYKKTFEIDLVLNEGNFNRLSELFAEINETGLFKDLDDFLEDAINFRLLHHIITNAELQKDFMCHCNCKQT